MKSISGFTITTHIPTNSVPTPANGETLDFKSSLLKTAECVVITPQDQATSPLQIAQTEKTIQFPTKADFCRSLTTIPDRKCIHIVSDKPLTPGMFNGFEGTENIVFYHWAVPDNAGDVDADKPLVHVEVAYIDRKKSQIFFSPDSEPFSMLQEHENEFQKLGFTPCVTIAHLYNMAPGLQVDHASCSIMARRYGEKLEHLNHSNTYTETGFSTVSGRSFLDILNRRDQQDLLSIALSPGGKVLNFESTLDVLKKYKQLFDEVRNILDTDEVDTDSDGFRKIKDFFCGLSSTEHMDISNTNSDILEENRAKGKNPQAHFEFSDETIVSLLGKIKDYLQRKVDTAEQDLRLISSLSVYILPENFYGITQRIAPIALNEYFLIALRSSDAAHNVTYNRRSEKQKTRELWSKYFGMSFEDHDARETKYFWVINKISSRTYAEEQSKGTSYIRKLYDLERINIANKEESIQMACEIFKSFHIVPTQPFFNAIGITNEGEKESILSKIKDSST